MKKFLNKITGNKGEDIACDFLKKSHYKIIERNYRYSKNAEIDIIAQDGDCLVFVEVKTRASLNFGHPFEAIDIRKLQKIQSAAYSYLAMNEDKYKSYRIDGIAIIGLENPSIEHIKNIGQF